MSQDPYTGSYYRPKHPYSHERPHDSQQEQQVLYAMPAASGSQHQQRSHDGPPPQPTPRPFAQAIQELLRQYLKVLTKPSERTFSQEMGKANWHNVWVQAAISVIMLTITLIASLWHPSTLHMQVRDFINVLIPLGSFVASIIFIGPGIRYLLARAFRGQGTFLVQWYTDLLFIVPLTTVCALFVFPALVFGIFLPSGISAIILSIFFIYMFVLPIFSIMAVHRLSRGKAIAIVFIALPIIVVTFMLLSFLLGNIIRFLP